RTGEFLAADWDRRGVGGGPRGGSDTFGEAHLTHTLFAITSTCPFRSFHLATPHSGLHRSVSFPDHTSSPESAGAVAHRGGPAHRHFAHPARSEGRSAEEDRRFRRHHRFPQHARGERLRARCRGL